MKRTRLCLSAILSLLTIPPIMAQSVGIGTVNPKPSARLEINSTSQGILIPTLTSSQRNTIINPATGLLVFQTDGTPGFYYYTGMTWINLTNGSQPNSDGIALSSNYGLTTTFAGSGAFGDDDGAATIATFEEPLGLGIDALGNIYVADAGNNKIRKITPAGVVSTIAGNGTADSRDGDAATASFNYPNDVAIDASGNIYVAEGAGNRIRKITPGGVVSTFAGTGIFGSTDGNGDHASFSFPKSIAVDASGYVYVAEWYSHKIRRITPGGVVSTLAGNGNIGAADGPAASATFYQPEGIAVDALGNVYVADALMCNIRKITPTGQVSTIGGTGFPGDADGIGTAASFDQPTGIAVDAFGNVYVADRSNQKIRKMIPLANGTYRVTTLAGNGSYNGPSIDGIGTAAGFTLPRDVIVDASGNLYVSELNSSNNKIRKVIAQ